LFCIILLCTYSSYHDFIFLVAILFVLQLMVMVQPGCFIAEIIPEEPDQDNTCVGSSP